NPASRACPCSAALQPRSCADWEIWETFSAAILISALSPLTIFLYSQPATWPREIAVILRRSRRQPRVAHGEKENGASHRRSGLHRTSDEALSPGHVAWQR